MVSIVWCTMAQVLADVQTIHLYLQGQIGPLKDPEDLSFEAQNPLKYYEVPCLPIARRNKFHVKPHCRVQTIRFLLAKNKKLSIQ